MRNYIESDIVLTKTGIQYQTNGKKKEIPYLSIVWLYIRKKTGERVYQHYSLLDVTLMTTGELVITDFGKNKYIFSDAYLNRPAGRVFSDILEYYNACFAGYDFEDEVFWYSNFKKMVQACRMMQKAYGLI